MGKPVMLIPSGFTNFEDIIVIYIRDKISMFYGSVNNSISESLYIIEGKSLQYIKKEKPVMKRIIKSTTDISLKEKTSGNFTPDEVVELLSAIEELKSKYIKAVDRGDGKLDFCIGDDVYETDKGIAV